MNRKRIKINMTDFTKIKVALAPLAGVSDYAFRKICADHKMKYAVCEMVSAKAMHYNDKKTAELAYIRPSEPDIAVQLFGSEPDIIAEAAKKLAENSYAHNRGSKLPVAIDINMGCPVQKIVSNGEGSALMKSPELVGRIVRAAVDAQPLPVTVKIRAGWDENSINAVQIARIAEENGASMICVHGRTREEMYISNVRLDIIKAVKESVKIPVFANGGIMCAYDAMKMLKETGADGIMIARGAMGNPWIFEEIDAALNGTVYRKPDRDEIVSTALSHIRLMIKEKGEKTGVAESRKHIACYTKGMPGSASLRESINHAESFDEIEAIMRKLMNK